MSSRTELFADIDSMVPEAFTRHLAEDVTMRLGNAAPLLGRAACLEAWAGFCQIVDGVQHDVAHQWQDGDTTIVEASVTYTRKDGVKVCVPACTVYRASGGLIDEYRVYFDVAQVFA